LEIFLLLGGHDGNVLGKDARRALQSGGQAALIIEDFCDYSAKVGWSLDSERQSSLIRPADGVAIRDREIRGVLVRKLPFERRDGWSAKDASYRYAEKEAAMLGWIWSLSCPVINRYSPELWFGQIDSIDYWHGRLECFGLELEPLRQWDAKRSYLVSVIGSKVIWDRSAPGRLRYIDDALVQFARSLGLTYIEYTIANSVDKPRVAAVEPFPTYHGFCPASRQEIVSELIANLTASENHLLARTPSDSWF
jgi:hypothetical protein